MHSRVPTWARWKAPGVLEPFVVIQFRNFAILISFTAMQVVKPWVLTSATQEHNWERINRIIKENKIGILAVTEAHLDEQRAEIVETLSREKLKVFFSKSPNTNNAQG